MVWNTANAYESTDGGLVLEVATTIAKRRRLVRICVHDPLASHGSCRDVSDQDLSMEAHSFPSVNPFFLGIKERYVYALSDPYSLTAKLWKYDTTTGKHLSWQGEEGQVMEYLPGVTSLCRATLPSLPILLNTGTLSHACTRSRLSRSLYRTQMQYLAKKTMELCSQWSMIIETTPALSSYSTVPHSKQLRGWRR